MKAAWIQMSVFEYAFWKDCAVNSLSPSPSLELGRIQKPVGCSRKAGFCKGRVDRGRGTSESDSKT